MWSGRIPESDVIDTVPIRPLQHFVFQASTQLLSCFSVWPGPCSFHPASITLSSPPPASQSGLVLRALDMYKFVDMDDDAPDEADDEEEEEEEEELEEEEEEAAEEEESEGEGEGAGDGRGKSKLRQRKVGACAPMCPLQGRGAG